MKRRRIEKEGDDNQGNWRLEETVKLTDEEQEGLKYYSKNLTDIQRDHINIINESSCIEDREIAEAHSNSSLENIISKCAKGEEKFITKLWRCIKNSDRDILHSSLANVMSTYFIRCAKIKPWAKPFLIEMLNTIYVHQPTVRKVLEYLETDDKIAIYFLVHGTCDSNAALRPLRQDAPVDDDFLHLAFQGFSLMSMVVVRQEENTIVSLLEGVTGTYKQFMHHFDMIAFLHDMALKSFQHGRNNNTYTSCKITKQRMNGARLIDVLNPGEDLQSSRIAIDAICEAQTQYYSVQYPTFEKKDIKAILKAIAKVREEHHTGNVTNGNDYIKDRLMNNPYPTGLVERIRTARSKLFKNTDLFKKRGIKEHDNPIMSKASCLFFSVSTMFEKLDDILGTEWKHEAGYPMEIVLSSNFEIGIDASSNSNPPDFYLMCIKCGQRVGGTFNSLAHALASVPDVAVWHCIAEQSTRTSFFSELPKDSNSSEIIACPESEIETHKIVDIKMSLSYMYERKGKRSDRYYWSVLYLLLIHFDCIHDCEGKRQTKLACGLDGNTIYESELLKQLKEDGPLLNGLLILAVSKQFSVDENVSFAEIAKVMCPNYPPELVNQITNWTVEAHDVVPSRIPVETEFFHRSKEECDLDWELSNNIQRMMAINWIDQKFFGVLSLANLRRQFEESDRRLIESLMQKYNLKNLVQAGLLVYIVDRLKKSNNNNARYKHILNLPPIALPYGFSGSNLVEYKFDDDKGAPVHHSTYIGESVIDSQYEHKIDQLGLGEVVGNVDGRLKVQWIMRYSYFLELQRIRERTTPQGKWVEVSSAHREEVRKNSSYKHANTNISVSCHCPLQVKIVETNRPIQHLDIEHFLQFLRTKHLTFTSNGRLKMYESVLCPISVNPPRNGEDKAFTTGIIVKFNKKERNRPRRGCSAELNQTPPALSEHSVPIKVAVTLNAFNCLSGNTTNLLTLLLESLAKPHSKEATHALSFCERSKLEQAVGMVTSEMNTGVDDFLELYDAMSKNGFAQTSKEMAKKLFYFEEICLITKEYPTYPMFLDLKVMDGLHHIVGLVPVSTTSDLTHHIVDGSHPLKKTFALNRTNLEWCGNTSANLFIFGPAKRFGHSPPCKDTKRIKMNQKIKDKFLCQIGKTILFLGDSTLSTINKSVFDQFNANVRAKSGQTTIELIEDLRKQQPSMPFHRSIILVTGKNDFRGILESDLNSVLNESIKCLRSIVGSDPKLYIVGIECRPCVCKQKGVTSSATSMVSRMRRTHTCCEQSSRTRWSTAFNNELQALASECGLDFEYIPPPRDMIDWEWNDSVHLSPIEHGRYIAHIVNSMRGTKENR